MPRNLKTQAKAPSDTDDVVLRQSYDDIDKRKLRGIFATLDKLQADLVIKTPSGQEIVLRKYKTNEK